MSSTAGDLCTRPNEAKGDKSSSPVNHAVLLYFRQMTQVITELGGDSILIKHE